MVTQQGSHRNLIFISFSQFGAASSFNFLNVFLPFYIFNISPYSFEETLLWIAPYWVPLASSQPSRLPSGVPDSPLQSQKCFILEG
jgi:hypothetical protein